MTNQFTIDDVEFKVIIEKPTPGYWFDNTFDLYSFSIKNMGIDPEDPDRTPYGNAGIYSPDFAKQFMMKSMQVLMEIVDDNKIPSLIITSRGKSRTSIYRRFLMNQLAKTSTKIEVIGEREGTEGNTYFVLSKDPSVLPCLKENGFKTKHRDEGSGEMVEKLARRVLVLCK